METNASIYAQSVPSNPTLLGNKSVLQTDLADFMQASLRISKNNLFNENPQILTWAAQRSDPINNSPIKFLKRWWGLPYAVNNA